MPAWSETAPQHVDSLQDLLSGDHCDVGTLQRLLDWIARAHIDTLSAHATLIVDKLACCVYKAGSRKLALQIIYRVYKPLPKAVISRQCEQLLRLLYDVLCKYGPLDSASLPCALKLWRLAVSSKASVIDATRAKQTVAIFQAYAFDDAEERNRLLAIECLAAVVETQTVLLHAHFFELLPDVEGPSLWSLIEGDSCRSVRQKACHAASTLLQRSARFIGAAQETSGHSAFTSLSARLAECVFSAHATVIRLLASTANRAIQLDLLKLARSLVTVTPLSRLVRDLLNPMASQLRLSLVRCETTSELALAVYDVQAALSTAIARPLTTASLTTLRTDGQHLWLALRTLEPSAPSAAQMWQNLTAFIDVLTSATYEETLQHIAVLSSNAVCSAQIRYLERSHIRDAESANSAVLLIITILNHSRSSEHIHETGVKSLGVLLEHVASLSSLDNVVGILTPMLRADYFSEQIESMQWASSWSVAAACDAASKTQREQLVPTRLVPDVLECSSSAKGKTHINLVRILGSVITRAESQDQQEATRYFATQVKSSDPKVAWNAAKAAASVLALPIDHTELVEALCQTVISSNNIKARLQIATTLSSAMLRESNARRSLLAIEDCLSTLSTENRRHSFRDHAMVQTLRDQLSAARSHLASLLA
ncbi:uncharacterized protein L969DRAFT_23430 [Mixia osmundae IAM 14324]|uniref:DUF4042 domain-containing protein n=1 Tax=Mixia osmundae (strain CBS 9802 / IAM 14324 / JCM 22182 / KY 12970) TaxID=764103 RepID=G7E8V5_MIXOS|nr:uncharacterized protein L969DRAFT_23430 [Mixia osmundae IAM 14324]KEI40208.1 hypothetical protein L969DRAFT_23430 [Mixia osmundae IAM 14324]GAA99573.1 hypothetical protein E5Q_06274 [Mixia osmundae IAM 14324]